MKKTDGISVLAKSLWIAVFTVVAIFGFTLPAILLDGYVLMKLWAWLIVPTFTSLPHLSLAAAIGISIVAGFVTRTYHYDWKPDSEKNKFLLGEAAFLYLAPLFTLLVGYFVSLYI